MLLFFLNEFVFGNLVMSFFEIFFLMQILAPFEAETILNIYFPKIHWNILIISSGVPCFN